MNNENKKQAKRLLQKTEKQYLQGRHPTIKDGIATFSDGSQYQVLHTGWRKIKK